MTKLFTTHWTYNLHHQPNPKSIISPTMVVVSERHTWLACLNASTGQVCWRVPVGTPWGNLAYTSQWIVHCGTTIQCFDRVQGTCAWTHHLTDRYPGYLVANSNSVLIGGWRGYMPLQCLDIATGTVQWIGSSHRVLTCPLVGSWGIATIDRGEFKPTDPATLLLLDAHGRIWRSIRMPAGVMYSDHETSMQAYSDHLLVVTREGQIWMLNPHHDDDWIETGIHPAGITTIAPVRSGTTLIFRDGDGYLCAYNLGNGTLRWCGPQIHQHWRGVPSVELPDGRWVIDTGNGQIIMISPDGVMLGTQKIAQRISTALAWTINDLLVVGTKGVISAFSEEQ